MVTHNAESALGIAPQAAHRSGRESLDSSGSSRRVSGWPRMLGWLQAFLEHGETVESRSGK